MAPKAWAVRQCKTVTAGQFDALHRSRPRRIRCLNFPQIWTRPTPLPSAGRSWVVWFPTLVQVNDYKSDSIAPNRVRGLVSKGGRAAARQCISSCCLMRQSLFLRQQERKGNERHLRRWRPGEVRCGRERPGHIRCCRAVLPFIFAVPGAAPRRACRSRTRAGFVCFCLPSWM